MMHPLGKPLKESNCICRFHVVFFEELNRVEPFIRLILFEKQQRMSSAFRNLYSMAGLLLDHFNVNLSAVCIFEPTANRIVYVVIWNRANQKVLNGALVISVVFCQFLQQGGDI